jgi:translation initiation factor 2B subunit (eIF-2B alpha/beta/delta family)
MTHSNSATVREALLHAPPDRVVCTVSEPIGEGRELADTLREAGVTVDLVADDDATHAAGTVNLLLVGADTVFRDGSLANKTGTSALCRAAREAGIPIVVACETIKLAPTDPHETEEELFDLARADDVDRYVTEEGIFPSGEIHTLVDRTPFLREGYELLLGTAARSG